MKKLQNAYAPLFPYLPLAQDAVLAPGELTVVNFAGAGGASEGIARATRRPVNAAINHNADALGAHRLNSPHTTHYIEDVWHVDPREVAAGRPVALAQFSPDCTHFSRARNGKPKSQKIRGLAWVAVRWAATVRPRVIMLENVEAFQTWGPLGPDGQADPKQEGRTYRSFLNALRAHGYVVDSRMLRACDYGTGTTRTRFVLIARCDGRPIVWPVPTHAAPTDPRVLRGELLPWPVAGDFIDWERPVPSVFEPGRDLAFNSLRRIARGFQRHTLEAERPYIVHLNHGGVGFRGQTLDEPMRTLTASHEALGLTLPCIAENNHRNPANSVTEPLSTITTQSNRHLLVTGQIVKAYGGNYQGYGSACSEPLDTITTQDHNQLATAHLTVYNRSHDDFAQSLSVPLRTIRTKDSFALTLSSVYRNFGSNVSGASCHEPVPTIMTTGNGKLGVVSAEVHSLPTTLMDERAGMVYDLVMEHLEHEALAGHLDHDQRRVLLVIGGVQFVVWDLCMRMMEPYELKLCQGFPADYVLERNAAGKKLSKKLQNFLIGNSFPPQVQEALTLANLSETPISQAAD